MRSLYVHVPFCSRKCPYCAFESAPQSDGDEDVFVAALEAEASRRACDVSTIYVGGGTPSVLSLSAWRRLFDVIERRFPSPPGAEFTVEANPSSLTDEHVSLWAAHGVTRVSIGVQSFDPDELAYLGRPHSVRDAEEAVLRASRAGLSVSLDLIFGSSRRSVRSWGEDLRRAVSLAPDHISIYQLTIEPGTPFDERGVEASDGYAEYRLAQWYLPRKRYEQYEVASFARPGAESRHNMNYWDEGEYVGIGPGAWSFIDGTRSKNAYPLREWADLVIRTGYATCWSERMEGEIAAREAAMLALRTSRGIDVARHADRYGQDATDAIIAELAALPPDLVSITQSSARLTKRGMRLGSVAWRAIAPDASE